MKGCCIAFCLGGFFVFGPRVVDAYPAFQSPKDLVVARVGNGSGVTDDTAQPVFLDEYDISGGTPTLVNTVSVPSAGASALTMAGTGSHEGLLNRTVDHRYLVFAGYRADAGTIGDSADGTVFGSSSAGTPRVIGLATRAGSVDTSTALSDSYDTTSVRAATSDNGGRFWVAGDNAAGHIDTGGTRYVASVGATTSTNLSQVQGTGQTQTPDNIRSISIFDGQLYNSSGSSASVGKDAFKVGSGKPTSGAQTLTALTHSNDSTNAMFLADLSLAVPGLDTLYISSSSGLSFLAKFSLVGSDWVADGTVNLSNIEALTARVTGTTTTLYATTLSGVYRLVDGTGYHQSITGLSFGAPYIAAAADTAFHGVAFAPSLYGDVNEDNIVDISDIQSIAAKYLTASENGDANGDGIVDVSDIQVIAGNWLAHGGQGAGQTGLAVPEPSSWTVAWLAMSVAAAGRWRARRRTRCTSRPGGGLARGM